MDIELVTNPRADEKFRLRANELLDRGARTPGVLQSALREEYPSAVVRERQLHGESGSVWYVYRDGRWSGGN